VLILSCGRTGTNMLLEILRGSYKLDATYQPEDKQIFRKSELLHTSYLSKCDTTYINNLESVDSVMNLNKDLKILWTIRDLRDCSLSKIYRGQPGNDVSSLADDATPEGCLKDLEWMFQVYNHLISTFPDRILLVKMEDVILNFDETIQRVCKFINIEFVKNMKKFTNRYRQPQTHERYKHNGIDKNQICLYKNIYEIYGGFYKTYPVDVKKFFNKLEKYQIKFGYK
jgi:hypothetical protein